MAKYDDAFKRKVVESFQYGEYGYAELARQLNISSHSTVKKWVKTVELRGFSVLRRRRTKQTYSSQFKQDVIHYYLTSGDSYPTAALRYGLPSGDLLQRWHQVYQRDGMEGLAPKPKGRPSMTKKKKKIGSKRPLTREQELERENELLRAELAFVKKLRALGMNIPDRLKSETPESSTHSERNSD